MTAPVKVVKYDYEPHDGPQTKAHGIHVDELLYGGAAGGGKVAGHARNWF